MATSSGRGTRKNPLSNYTVSSATEDIIFDFARRSHESAKRKNRRFHHGLTAESARNRAKKNAEVAEILNEYEKIYKHLKTDRDRGDLKDVMERLAENNDPSTEKLRRIRQQTIPFWREKAGLPVGGGKSKRRRYKKARRTRKMRRF
jgi:bisphosphoglycerate-dependent phosphoglycerate mutase